MTSVLKEHLGEAKDYSSSQEEACFVIGKYHGMLDDMLVYPMILITGCCESDTESIGAFERSQMWDCPEHEKILSECGYQVLVTDLLGSVLEAADRANMLADLTGALLKLYPSCEAVYFGSSGKMFRADKLRSSSVPYGNRFIYYAVNVRFFNIEGTEDKLVDTLGMSILGLPDLQYHFRKFDPNAVVNHAYNMLSYIFENNCPIEDGDTVDGMKNGSMNKDVQWQCFYEDALIQPPREVIDICMGQFAAGNREQG